MIERAFVISLPHCHERLVSFRNQTAALRSIPEIELWPAIHGDTCQHPPIWTAGNGAWGCYKSHLNILEYCLNNRVQSYVVFEDDAQFRPDFDTLFEEFYSHLPSSWQQIYLGGQLQYENIHPPIKVSDFVYRPFNVNRTHAFAVSANGMLPIYKHICNLPFWAEHHIDHHLGLWHEDHRNEVYCPPKWLVGQMGYPSTVSDRTDSVTFYADPESLSLKHWLIDDPVCIYYMGDISLLLQARRYLHRGNQIESHGYDVTIANAIKYKEPHAEINRWYQWIRTEIVRSNSEALPCFYCPIFTPEQVQEATGAKVIVIRPHSLSEIIEKVQEISHAK